LLLINFSCQRTLYVCGTYVLPESEWIESKISSIKTIAITHQDSAIISGQILCIGEYLNGNNEKAAVYFPELNFTTDQDTIGHKIIGDIDGLFSGQLKAGLYNLHIKYIGVNDLIISNLKLEKGEQLELHILLGQGFGKDEYYLVGQERTLIHLNSFTTKLKNNSLKSKKYY
jgi:hypothetical protein